MTDSKQIPATLPPWLADNAEEVKGWGPAPAARSCWVAGCTREANLHGLCKTHHLRAERRWKPRPSDAGRWRDDSTGRKYTGVAPTPDEETTDAKEAQQ